METSAVPAAIEPIDFAARWRAIVDRRRVQMDREYAAAGTDSSDYWARRAKTYRQAMHDRTDEDPFLQRVRASVHAESAVLDVGAGTGRHSLALAPVVARVTAVDPSPAMLGLLREDAAAQKLTNVTAIDGEWMQAVVDPADVVICSHVLYPIADVVPFLERLEAHARDRVFIYLRADPLNTDFGLWSEFYGVPLQGHPNHADLFGVLAQMDIFADVEIVEHAFSWTFASLDEAAAQLRNSLCLRDGDDAAYQKLETLLRDRLVTWPNGRLGPPAGSLRSAVISWSPRQQPRS